MDKLISRFLGIIERREEELLAWGIADGGFSYDELLEAASGFVQDTVANVSPHDLLIEVESRKLLFRFSLMGVEIYRTRMAETVRLLSTLRQWFPNADWRSAPRLVADYRISLAPRRYPQRSITPQEFVLRLATDAGLKLEIQNAVRALIDVSGLSDFQLHAARRLCLDFNSRESRGMIICAGTGTGKTLAYYLPALASLTEMIEADLYWTKLIALYPRNELLKDQVSEVFKLARRLDGLLLSDRRRKIRIGVYYGDTPTRANVDEVRRLWKITPDGAGFICPFLRCPTCGEKMAWLRSSMQAGVEECACMSPSCGTTAGKDEVILTRAAMRQQPPDILFTTTEMLNRNISDDQDGPVFGVGGESPPRLVLLDEVHTYSGTSGAQIALLLRRWKHASGANAQFTGLSATLRDAGRFFATLSGVSESKVTEVSPTEELLEEGMEYCVALRGDPVSETALLSTTIQTAMLMRRTLDPGSNGQLTPSHGFYGNRVFAFTDNLDVTNRLFHNLLNAEGRDSFGNRLRDPLAALRSRQGPQEPDRFRNGQSWRVCEEIGHPVGLLKNLRVTRTSSQDPGVDFTSDVIVATASLEVGYNDPEVGVVLQHKAPMDLAGFMQRRGRAGRPRSMRPWTVVVLSDYGRDRTAYQAYDLLFDPELQPRHLPVRNRYVLRMQAVFAFMDWIAHQTWNGPNRGDVWMDFAQAPSPQYQGYRGPRQQREADIIELLLSGDPALNQSLETWIVMALRLEEDELTALLWEPPRALMTSVLPTLLRRLRTGWRCYPWSPTSLERDYQSSGSPLPDFVPANLFSDLNLPEVRILVRQSAGSGYEEHQEPILRAMQTLAPGHVTRRFAIQRADVSHWVAPRTFNSVSQTLEIGGFCTVYQELGEFASWENGSIVRRRCVRPVEYTTSLVPATIRPSSRSTLEWRTQILRSGNGRSFAVPSSWLWGSLISEATFFLHNHHCYANVRRFAIAATAELKHVQMGNFTTRIEFCQRDGRRPVGIGFTLPVDAIRFRIELPDEFRLDPSDSNQPKVRAFRAAYFRHRVHQSVRLQSKANVFLRERLYEVYLSALLWLSLEHGIDLAESNARLSLPGGVERVCAVLDSIFQTTDADVDETDDQESDDEERETTPGKMHSRLIDLLKDRDIYDALGAEASVLWQSPDANWHAWAAERMRSTVGRALLQACLSLSPQFDPRDLLLDLDPGPPDTPEPAVPSDRRRTAEVWISESTIGGAGIIEELFRLYTSDQRRFYQIAQNALDPSELEDVDAALMDIIPYVPESAEARTVVDAMRLGITYTQKERALADLKNFLLRRGFTPHHSLISALSNRLLRPGTSHATDELYAALVRLLRTEEQRLGVELDTRVFAYVASQHPAINGCFVAIPEFAGLGPQWRYGALYSLLWAHGNSIRSRGLHYQHPYYEQAPPEREIVLDYLLRGATVIDVLDEDWDNRVTSDLTRSGSARLRAPIAQRERLQQCLLAVSSTPFEVGALLLYPTISRFRQDGSWIEITLQIRETI